MAVFSLSTLLQNVPPGSRALTAALLAFSLLLFFLRLRTGLGFGTASAVQFPWLVIVPGASFWYPWTLLTSSFCESSILEFLVSIVSLPLAARYLERQWGAIELFKFAAVVLAGSNIIAWGLQLLLFGVFRKEVLIWGIQFHGLQALQTAFLVAFTQLIPEHQVQVLSGAVKIRVKDLPMLYVTVSNVMCLLGYTSPWILIQFGWLISWAYLRFFKVNESGLRVIAARPLLLSTGSRPSLTSRSNSSRQPCSTCSSSSAWSSHGQAETMPTSSRLPSTGRLLRTAAPAPKPSADVPWR